MVNPQAPASNWIQEEADRLAKQKTQDREEFDRRKFERETLLAYAPEAFQALIEAVRQDIEGFNKLYPRHDERLNPLEIQGNTGFQVKRAYDPEFELTARLNPNKPEISYTVKVPHPANGSKRVTAAGLFGISLQKSLSWILLDGVQAISVSTASQMLLKGAVDPTLVAFLSGS
ncbi:MAG TPA: hypothetical protein VHX63_16300 [Acidobacteriaceae bacterium]|jgi:hypothetical protein|nr:hypothetical protein [Acidobacteriaceae bacterium]